MTHTKSFYSMLQAADLAKCEPSDLLHHAVQRRINLLVGVPDWVDLRVYDEAKNTDCEPFLIVPQLLVLKQSYCLKVEINGHTEQSDFSEGYFIESSGELKRILPSYGLPELNHEWVYWRTYRNGLVNLLELVPERLFVRHCDLAQFLESDIKPEAGTAKTASSKPRKSERTDHDVASQQQDSPKMTRQNSEPIIPSADSDPRKASPKVSEENKQPYDEPKKRSEPSPKPDVLLRLKQVQVRTGLSRSTIYNRLNPKSQHFDPTFPKQIQIGTDSVGWLESEVQAWVESKITASRGEVKPG